LSSEPNLQSYNDEIEERKESEEENFTSRFDVNEEESNDLATKFALLINSIP
jgi:hypothetical protein